jgi:energy-coupling factor transporter ATP-binding protein EcfA2
VVALRQDTYRGEELQRLAAALQDLDFGPFAPELAEERDRLAGIIRSYLIPKIAGPSHLLTVVVAGPTGSGKSTLVNTITGLAASRTGALRPTTSVPVVVAPASRADEFAKVCGVGVEVVRAPEGTLPGDMVIVDTPDIDSTSTGHRVVAEEVIDLADVVVFVTSALRYADDVPWQVLRRAESRGAPVIHVLNRVESASSGSVVDFGSRLANAGFEGAPIKVSEYHLAAEADRLPEVAVRALRRRFEAVAAESEELAAGIFSRVARSTAERIDTLVRSVRGLVDEIEALEAQATADLAQRPSRLDLSGLGSGLHPEPPTGGGLSRRRWVRRAARAHRPEPGTLENVVGERLAHIVTYDIRLWLGGDGHPLRQRGLDATHVIDGVLASARAAAQGWIEYVGRIAADFDDRNTWLCQVALLDAAAADRVTLAVEILIGEQGPVLVERARRELLRRIEVIYEHAGALVADGLRHRYGDNGEPELRVVLGAATALRAPVDA